MELKWDDELESESKGSSKIHETVTSNSEATKPSIVVRDDRTKNAAVTALNEVEEPSSNEDSGHDESKPIEDIDISPKTLNAIKIKLKGDEETTDHEDNKEADLLELPELSIQMLEDIQQASKGVIEEKVAEKLKLSAEMPFRIEECDFRKTGPNLSGIISMIKHALEAHTTPGRKKQKTSYMNY